ncbi:MAG: hypothetical protein WCL44_06070 [bacterium]
MKDNMKRCICSTLVSASLVAACITACSRERPPAEAQTRRAMSVPKEDMDPERSSNLPVHRTGESTQPQHKAPAELDDVAPFMVCAFQQIGGTNGARVVDSTGLESFIQEGDICHGYQIVTVNSQEGHVIIQRSGKQYVLKAMSGSSTERNVPEQSQISDSDNQAPVNPSAAEGSTTPDALPSDIDRTLDHGTVESPAFAPTPAETQAGIDPNDPATWPDGYRGPAIERAIAPEQ